MSEGPVGARRTAVVGGASSGLGEACARALAARGHDLLLWSRSAERLAVVADSLAAPGRTVRTVAADASDPGAAERVASAALDAFDHVDVLVLNAGGPPPAGAQDVDPDGLRSALQLLTVTPVDLALRLLPGMRARGFGRIAAVLSSGVREPIDALAYSNTGRSALWAWMKTLSRAVAADGVTVNGVVPGRLDTPRVASLDAAAAARAGTDPAEVRATSEASIPAGRYGRPDELAEVVAFLASDAGAYVTGTAVPVDGGMLRGLP